MTEHVSSRRTAVDPLDRSTVRAPPRRRSGAAHRRAGLQLGLVLAESDRRLLRPRPTRRRQRRALTRELGTERAGRGDVRLRTRRRHARGGAQERASPGPPVVRRVQECGVDVRAHVGAQQPGTVPARRRRAERDAGLHVRGGDSEADPLGLQPGTARSRREGLRGAHRTPRGCRSRRHGRDGAGRDESGLLSDSRDRNRAGGGGMERTRAFRADRARACDTGGEHLRPEALGVERPRRERIVVADLR